MAGSWGSGRCVRACVAAGLCVQSGIKRPPDVLFAVRRYEPSLGVRDEVVSAGTVVYARSAVRELLWVGCGVLSHPGMCPVK